MSLAAAFNVRVGRRHLLHAVGLAFWLILLPLVLAGYFLKIWKYDLYVPFYYDNTDSIWQFTLTKLLLDTGWILTNPLMGAPDVAHWYGNPAGQASALHSVIMWMIGIILPDAIAVQQLYYILNFALITITGYMASRLIGVSRYFSVCSGLIFAFLPVKFNLIAYAYLSNYFMVPLSIVPAIWILTGQFSYISPNAPGDVIDPIRKSRAWRCFWISLAVVVLSSATDGYYAFFALLLLGFSALLRAIMGDARRPMSLVSPAVLMAALVVTALGLAAPLRAYRHTHPDEFAPHGVVDPVFVRRAAEADMYSTSLKVMLAPSDRHRIPALARIGRYIVATNNEGRVYPRSQWSPLGTLGSVLFLTMLGGVAVMLVGGGGMPFRRRGDIRPPTDVTRLLGAITTLSLFVTGSSIFGGFGTIIALVYPTIRAYDRFPLFLSFLLLCAAAVILTNIESRYKHSWKALLFHRGAAAVITVLALFDQAPADLLRAGDATRDTFLAERHFVRGVEAGLPDMAMVYQEPYSNYLTKNRYYGWGSFADMRFYLHSRHLRWSSGASKNSPVDQWHERLARLPTEQRLTEVQAAGFQGFLVDRTVVADSEYAGIRSLLIDRTGQPPVEDAASGLAFWKLPDPGYRLVYGTDFVNPVRVVVTDPARLAREPVSRLLDRTALARLLATDTAGPPLVIERTAHPEVFRDAATLDLGLGETPIAAAPGDVSCPEDTGRALSVSRDRLTLRVHNRSGFDWLLNSAAAFPLRIGMMQLLDASGHQLRWDGGFRVAGALRIAEGDSAELTVPLAGLDMHTGVPDAATQVTAVFALLQEGNAWFGAASGNGVCRVTLER